MHCCSSKTKKKIMIIFFVLGILVIIIFLHRLKGEYVLLSKRNEDNEDGGNQKWIEKCTMYENQSTVLSKEVLTYITSCTSKTEKNCEHNEQSEFFYINYLTSVKCCLFIQNFFNTTNCLLKKGS